MGRWQPFKLGITGDTIAASLIKVDILHPDALTGDERADLVIANILAGPLTELSVILCSQVRSGGTMILSGILAEQATQLCQHYTVPLEVAAENEGWVALRGAQT